MVFWKSRKQTRGVGLNCSQCGYDLMRIVSPVCPECGASVLESVDTRDKALGLGPATQRPRSWPRRWNSPFTGIVMGTLLGGRCVYMFALALSGERLRHYSRSGSGLMAPLTGKIYYGLSAALCIWVVVICGIELMRRRKQGGRG